MLCLRDIFPGYGSSRRGEDAALMNSIMSSRQVIHLDRPHFYWYVHHGGNLWEREHFLNMLCAGGRLFAGDAASLFLKLHERAIPLSEYQLGLHR